MENEETNEKNNGVNSIVENTEWEIGFFDDFGDDEELGIWSNTAIDKSDEIEGYGYISRLDEYLNNSSRVIELLEHAKDKEQFNKILASSKPEAHDEKLLEYLKSKDYNVEDYISINSKYSDIYKFKELFEYLMSKSTEENIKQLLAVVAYVDENIANTIVQRDDRLEIIQSNPHFFWEKKVTEKIIEYFNNNPDKINFDFVNVCELDAELIKKTLELGYVINENSPDIIMQDNKIMRKAFLNLVDIDNQDIMSDIDRELSDIPGSYARLFKNKSKEVFSSEFMNVFEKEEFEQILKYIVLSDYDIDFSQMINDGNTSLIKNIYDNLNNMQEFDLNLFVNIVYKYNLFSDILGKIDETILESNKENLKIFFEHKDIEISSVDDIINIKQTIFENFDIKISSAKNSLELKNVICNMLANQTYLETKKGLLEKGNSEKLAVLKNSIEDPTINKEVDSYIILSDFLAKIDSIEDISMLKSIASLINKDILDNGFNDKWINLNDRIMNLYNHEINSRMTDFKEHMTDAFYDASDYTFDDGTSVKGRRVHVAHIKSEEEYNAFIHVLNAYRNGSTTGTIESLTNPKFIGQAYISLTGISDEYSRICVNRDSMFEIKVLYSHIPEGGLFCASNRDTGINACANSKNVSTRLPQNMMPFRRIVRNTETHGSETYNEFDVYRDNLVPSGIAFMGEQPTQKEINAAAYLNVPLVQIDDLQESYRKDYYSVFQSNLKYDESFYHIKEHSYEDEPVEVTPNDNFDKRMVELTSNLRDGQKDTQERAIEISTRKNERGEEEYIVDTQNDEYSVTPIYEYIDSKRENIDTEFFERDFIKIKLYERFGVEPKLKCVYGKYPNGKIALSILESKREDNEIDNCIRYLTQDIWAEDVEFLSKDAQSIMKRLAKIDDETYIEMFSNLIAVSNYTEPKKFAQDILNRKKKIESLLLDLKRENTNPKVSTRTLGEQVFSKMADTQLEDEYEQVINYLERDNIKRKDEVGKDE